MYFKLHWERPISRAEVAATNNTRCKYIFQGKTIRFSGTSDLQYPLQVVYTCLHKAARPNLINKWQTTIVNGKGKL